MGTWRQEAQESSWNASQDIAQKRDSFKNKLDQFVNGTKATLTGVLNGTTVVGINVNEIDNMRNAIRNYVSEIEGHLDKVKTEIDTSEAFKGDYAAAVTQYVSAIAEACKCVTSQLLSFSDKLVDVKEKYQAQDTNMKSTISSTATDVESSFSRYEEKK